MLKIDYTVWEFIISTASKVILGGKYEDYRSLIKMTWDCQKTRREPKKNNFNRFRNAASKNVAREKNHLFNKERKTAPKYKEG